jgi:hypothetical protein
VKPRRARFRVAGRFNGAAAATVTITQYGDVALFSVRPFRSRTSYELPLATVASGVIWDVVRRTFPMRAGGLRPDEKTTKPRKRRTGNA